MLPQNGISNNATSHNDSILTPNSYPYPVCSSDYGPAPAPKPDTPGWRNAEPRFVHSLKWCDHDGIEHLHVVRSDDLDDVLRQVRTVKTFIAAAKARDEKPANCHAGVTVAEPEPEQTDSAYAETEPDDDIYCPTHGRAKLRPSKYGGVYCAARLRDGSYCKYKSRKGARS